MSTSIANLTAQQRIARRVVVDANGCHIWQGCINSKGYGVIGIGGKRLLTHRVSYEANVGPIPEGLTIDHLCRVKLCANHKHLEPVTGAENTQRAAALITHCPQGHPLSGENLLTKKRPGGKTFRNCRECANAAQRRRRAASLAS